MRPDRRHQTTGELQLEERRRPHGPTLADLGAKPLPKVYFVTELDYFRLRERLHDAWAHHNYGEYQGFHWNARRLAL